MLIRVLVIVGICVGICVALVAMGAFFERRDEKKNQQSDKES